MSRHRYPFAALRADYLRAAFGLLLTGGPLLATSGPPATVWVLGGLSTLFLGFGLRTAWRQMLRFDLSADGISRTGVSTFGVADATLPWSELTRIRLRFYSTRRGRDRGTGWMQLKLAAGRKSLAIESSLEGFRGIVSHAAAVARSRNIESDPSTANNFAALGLALNSEAGPEVGPESGRR